MKLNYLKRVTILVTIILLLPTTIKAQWTQIGSDLNGVNILDGFGSAVSLNNDGSILAVGIEVGDGSNGTDSGLVKVYNNSGNSWTQLGSDINGEASGDTFGNALSLNASGNRIVIGGANNDNANGTDSGHVRVYEYGKGWSQIGNDIDGESTSNRFGSSVAINNTGNIIAVGAPFADGTNGANSGHVRVFELITNNWVQIGADIDGEAASNRFGESVSMNSDGTIIAIGGTLNNDNGTNSGHVRVFENIAGTWTQIGTDIDGAAEDLVGTSVSLNDDGTIVVIGAPSSNTTNSGLARVYENIADVWTQIGADIDGEAADDQFGYSVSITGNGLKVAIGGRLNDGSATNGGHARVFTNNGGTWTQEGQDIDGVSASGVLGDSISLSNDGNEIAVGAPFGNVFLGYVQVYTSPTLSNNTFEVSNLKLYPNPSSESCTLTLSKIYSTIDIAIYNVLGKQLYKKTYNTTDIITLDTSSYSKGVYLIDVNIDGVSKVLKLIVN